MKNSTLILLLIFFTKAATSQFTFENKTDLLYSVNGISGNHPIVVCDLNNDGKDDIVVLDDFLIFNQEEEDSSFTYSSYDYSDAPSAWGICAGDIDNDGFSDILYGGYFNGLSLVKRTLSDPSYTRTVFDEEDFMVFLQGVNFADINNDGRLDIFACHDVGPSRIYLGNGLGSFERDTTLIDTELNGGGENDSGNYGSLFTDVNNDGHVDLYVAKCRQGVSDPTDPRRINLLYINNGDSTYTEEAADWGIASGEQSWSADFGDIDNDGDMDLLLGQHTGQYVQVYENNGDSTFSDITSSSGLNNSFDYHVIQSKFADFDNDGYLDIVVSGSSQFMFAHNNGDNTFTIVDSTNMFTTMNSFALGDLDNDGYMDIYSTPFGYGSWGSSGMDSMYINSGGTNNFMRFELQGVASNRDGIGARVSIYGDFGVQIRDIRSGESYGIQNSLNAHFGLGSSSTIDSAFIRWPSGIVDQLLSTSANQFLYIIEGSHPVGIKKIKKDNLSLEIYPNPASDQVWVKLNEHLSNKSDLTITVIDLLGKEQIMIQDFDVSQSINVQSLKSGIYIINLLVEGKLTSSQKIKIE